MYFNAYAVTYKKNGTRSLRFLGTIRAYDEVAADRLAYRMYKTCVSAVEEIEVRTPSTY